MCSWLRWKRSFSLKRRLRVGVDLGLNLGAVVLLDIRKRKKTCRRKRKGSAAAGIERKLDGSWDVQCEKFKNLDKQIRLHMVANEYVMAVCGVLLNKDLTLLQCINVEQPFNLKGHGSILLELAALVKDRLAHIFGTGLIVEVSPATAKKAATGNGRAEKHQVWEGVRKKVPLIVQWMNDPKLVKEAIGDAAAIALVRPRTS